MSYLALYRKWRPLVFDEVTEQEHVTVTLKNSVIAGRVSHAYLFCGTRGTGKTTVARIFARAINCTASEGGNPCNKCESCMDILSGRTVDVIEIDAASNNSVDNIRGVRDVVAYAPSISKYKVYIIDEVHMLSSGAFNALLKTLEEPPPHVVFFLATTEPHKLPATILSRCQRFDFKRITTEGIKNRLNEIAKADRALLDEDAARLIAILADGAMRDALSLLDQCMVSAGYDAAGPGSEFEATDQVASKQASGITAQTVRDVAGIADDKLISDMAEAALNRDISGITRLTDSILMQGAEISKFISNLIMYYRNMLVCRLTEDDSLIAGMTAESICRLKKQASLMGTEKIMQAIRKLSQTEPMLKWTNQPRIMLELAMIELCCEDEHPGSAGSAGAAGVTGVDGVTGAARAANAKASLDQQPAKTPAALEKASEDKHGEAEKSGTNNGGTLDSGETLKDAPQLRPIKKDIESTWQEVLEYLRKNRNMVVFSNLDGIRPVTSSKGVYKLLFSSGRGINKMIMSKPENLEILSRAFEHCTGEKAAFICESGDVEDHELKQVNQTETGSSEADAEGKDKENINSRAAEEAFTAKAAALAKSLGVEAEITE